MNMTLPWLTDVLDDLKDRFSKDRLPHALLFTGQEGVGKSWLAQQLAACLLCETNSACGQCKGCQLLAAGTHPDLKVVSLEDGAQQIKIEQVRELIDWVNQTAQMSGAKISVINPAHKVNRNSANALLKVMEEPPAGNYIVLISDDPAVLLPTIRSRSQQLLLAVPPLEQALAWLEEYEETSADWRTLLALSSGSPLLARDRADDEYLVRRQLIAGVWRDLFTRRAPVVQLADEMAKLDLVEVLEIAIEMLADVARLQATKNKNSVVNRDVEGEVTEISAQLDSFDALHFMKRFERDYRLAKGTQNPNQTLLLESLMADCVAPVQASEALL
jgi:DNA polymerase-3 subunit delta'